MSALPGGMSMDETSFDSNYLQFVVGLLDDSENYSDYIGRERADSISEFLKRERADSISDFLKQRDRQDSITDLLPKQSDFLMRDRAFSWDLNMEDQMHSDKARGIASASAGILKTDSSSSSGSGTGSGTGSGVDKKRKLDVKAPPVNSKQKGAKSPPLPVKTGTKVATAPQKSKVTPKDAVAEQNIKRAKTAPSADGSYVPQKTMDQYNIDISKIVPGAMLGQVMTHSLTPMGQPHTLTRYDTYPPIHMMGSHPAIHPGGMHLVDSSCPRVGAYTKEERQVIIAKFRAKKMRRVWRKQIKYDCRKRLADTRPRVKGRFVSRKGSDKDDIKDEHDLETGSGDGDYDDE